MPANTFWVTSGSIIPWRDTTRLDLPGEMWEGHIEQIPEGEARYAAFAGGLDGEAEWVALFEKPVQEIDMREDTRCTLQGLIEGTWLGQIVNEESAGALSWERVSVGNNVVASGEGVPTTLSALERGADGLDDVRVQISYRTPKGEKRRHSSKASELAEHQIPVLEVARAVSRWARRDPSIPPIYGINFGAVGPNSSALSEIDRRILALLGGSIRRLLRLEPTALSEMANSACREIVRGLINRGEYADREVKLQVNAGANVVGKARLLLEPADALV